MIKIILNATVCISLPSAYLFSSLCKKILFCDPVMTNWKPFLTNCLKGFPASLHQVFKRTFFFCGRRRGAEKWGCISTRSSKQFLFSRVRGTRRLSPSIVNNISLGVHRFCLGFCAHWCFSQSLTEWPGLRRNTLKRVLARLAFKDSSFVKQTFFHSFGW